MQIGTASEKAHTFFCFVSFRFVFVGKRVWPVEEEVVFDIVLSGDVYVGDHF